MLYRCRSLQQPCEVSIAAVLILKTKSQHRGVKWSAQDPPFELRLTGSEMCAFISAPGLELGIQHPVLKVAKQTHSKHMNPLLVFASALRLGPFLGRQTLRRKGNVQDRGLVSLTCSALELGGVPWTAKMASYGMRPSFPKTRACGGGL